MSLLPLPLLLFLLQAIPTPPNPTADVPSRDYKVGPADQLVIRAVDIAEFEDKAVRVDDGGDIDLHLIGRIHVAGQTVEEIERMIENHLRKYLNAPDITVALTEVHGQPISVLGAVQTPGVQQLQGEETLFQVLSFAAGLRSDAGNLVTITRRLEWGRVPLPNAMDDATGQFSVASVSVKSIMSGTSPQENITIKPYDVISVPRADIIYVIGAVHKSGGFVMGDNTSLSALQVLSLAEGLDRGAAPQSAKIMRRVDGTNNRAEIPLDLRKVLAGKGADLPLKADDILFVPTSATKSAVLRTFEAMVQVGTGLAIYH